MKKFFITLTLFSAICGQAMAQSILHLHENAVYGEQDTIECTLDHGIMLPLEGFAVQNVSAQTLTLIYKVEYVRGANISVGGVCTSGGQCVMGNTSNAFTLTPNNTFGFSLEMMVPEEVEYGDYALFHITAYDPNNMPQGTTDGTWLRVRCSHVGIQSARVASLQAFPNPTADRLVIQTGSTEGTLQVFNALGQIVLQQPVSAASSTTVNTQRWANGVYRCQLVSHGQVTASATVVKK